MDGRERRRQVRVPVHGEVVARIHSVENVPVIDLSEAGALVEVPVSLRPGSVYAFRLPVESGLTLRAKVVRSTVQGIVKLPNGDSQMRYRTAVEFVAPTRADVDVLRRHVNARAETPDPGAEPLSIDMHHTGEEFEEEFEE